jgi:phenylacetate-CoA ligase
MTDFTFYDDNQPVSILEAFAAGVPVVTTPTGDIAAMVRDGQTGVIVRDPDPAAFAQAIGALFQDEARATALARRAHDELSRYEWRSVSRLWRDVYAGPSWPRAAAAPRPLAP